MKKLKLVISIILLITFILPVCMVSVSAQDVSEYVTVRIESYDRNIYYKEVALDTTEAVTLATFLKKLDENDKTLSFVGIDNGYITEINGISSGKFDGFDGWLFMLNGESPSVGIGDIQLKKEDVVVLYYSDAFGEAGIQYPTIDDSKFETEGVLIFTSSDVTYDSEFNPTTTVNPVVGAVVTWSYGGGKTTQYTTNNKGEITIPAKQREKGSHSIQINRYTQSGLATVLRFASDFTFIVNTEPNTANTTTPTTFGPQEPYRGNTKMIFVGLSLILVAALIVVAISIHKKRLK
jgi:hypothetical protein